MARIAGAGAVPTAATAAAATLLPSSPSMSELEPLSDSPIAFVAVMNLSAKQDGKPKYIQGVPLPRGSRLG